MIRLPIIFIILSNWLLSQANTVDCSKSESIYRLMSTFHITNIPDQQLASRIPDQLIKLLDPDGLILLEPSIDMIRNNADQIMTDLKSGSCQYIQNVINEYADRYLEVNELLSSDLFNKIREKDDSIQLVPWHKPPLYARNAADFEEKWIKRVRYYALLTYVESEEFDSINSSDSYLIHRRRIIQEVVENEQCKLQQILYENKSLDTFVFHSFLKAIARSYDPHSEFFSEREANLFESTLSSDLVSSGLVVGFEAFGHYKIAQVVPGSAAWESGEIQEGDEIIGIHLENDYIHPACMGYRELINYLNSAEPEKIEITLKSKENKVKEVVLYKKKIPNVENKLSSFLLEGPLNIGYLSLPSFYTNWDNNSSNSAKDIALEIINLNQHRIQGLILDLRYNGGGSMKEAIDLAGLFIDKGPLMISEELGTEPVIYKDLIKGTFYDQKLIVLVNHFSASASEIVALSLQDYERALIVGSSTFGKATGQNILPAFTNGGGQPFGFVKISTSRFYDVDGETYQLNGIQPDILIRDIFPAAFITEKQADYPLPNRPISKSVKITKMKPLPGTILNTLSKERQAKNPIFQLIHLWEDSLTIAYDREFLMPLQIDRFLEKYQSYNQPNESLFLDNDSIFSISEKFNRHDDDRDLQKMDMIIRREVWSDPMIKECYRIFLDWMDIP